MKRIFFPSLVLIFLLGSCQSRYEVSDLQTIKMKKDEIPALNDLNIKLANVYSFENPDGGALTFVWKVIKAGDVYFLIDKHSNGGRVLSFTLEGRSLNNIGKIGKGPGEYLNALDFEIDENAGRIYVLSEAGKILEYDFSGLLMGEYSSKYYSSSFGLNASGNFYQYATSSEALNKHGIFEFDKKNNRHKTVFQKHTEWYPIEELNFFRYKERVFFREAFSNTIFEIKEGELIPIFFFDWQDKNYKKEFDNLDLVSLFEKMAFEGDFYSFRNMVLNDQLLYASFGDELNQLTYHVFHYHKKGETKAFFTENQDGFFVAVVINEKNQPGFFLDGLNLSKFFDGNPSVFDDFSSYQFCEESSYLVFFDVSSLESH
jgi:hypothetical protein